MILSPDRTGLERWVEQEDGDLKSFMKEMCLHVYKYIYIYKYIYVHILVHMYIDLKY